MQEQRLPEESRTAWSHSPGPMKGGVRVYVELILLDRSLVVVVTRIWRSIWVSSKVAL